MFHDYVDTIISQLVLPYADLLETNVVLKHFAEVNSNGLANGFVYRVLDVKLLKGVVGRVQN